MAALDPEEFAAAFLEKMDGDGYNISDVAAASVRRIAGELYRDSLAAERAHMLAPFEKLASEYGGARPNATRLRRAVARDLLEAIEQAKAPPPIDLMEELKKTLAKGGQ